jgi:DNA-binding beta-propeller fold protein YncE
VLKHISVRYLFLMVILVIFPGCPYQEGNDTAIESPFLSIINGLSESLSFIMTHGDDCVESDITTGQAPNQILKHNNQVYIVNSLSNSILVYDYANFSIILEFSTGTGTNPFKAVIVDDKIYITAYLTHQLLICDRDGSNKETVNIEILNEGDKTFYPFPQGTAEWNGYIFIACMYAEENSLTKARDPGRVAVFSIGDQSITGYIDTRTKAANSVYVDGNTLFIISSGTYDNGFDETGTIEAVDLTAVNLDLPANISPVLVAEHNSFGAFCIDGNRAWTGNLGNGTLRFYDTSTIPWSEQESISFPGGTGGMAYIPDILYAALTDELYVTEFNGNKVYILDPADLSVIKEYTCSSNSYGDAQFMLLVE